MNTPSRSGDTYQLFPVGLGGDPLQGQRVGVSSERLPVDTPAGGLPALLVVDTDDSEVSLAVRLVPLDAVPQGVLALGEDTATKIGLEEDGPAAFARLEQPAMVCLDAISLESDGARPAEEEARRLEGAGLAGHLLWIPDHAVQDLDLTVDGTPYRVRRHDAQGRTGVLAEIGPRTDAEVFVSGAHSGVDMVVLADCSTSMLVADIPAAPAGNQQFSEAPSGFGLRMFSRRAADRQTPKEQRVQVLRRALHRLVDERRTLRGRTSRIALMEFTTSAWQVFPIGGGMAEFDADSPTVVKSEFEQAIDAILPRQGQGTHIGNALDQASQLLRQYGKPGNEKLIVLVSDGGDWAPPDAQTTGEVQAAYEDPVRLMEHMHQSLGVRVHTVGISTPELYRAWIAEGNLEGIGLAPDHELLKAVSAVGGGDAAVMGGLDVLVRDFSELGAGTSCRFRPVARHTIGGALSHAVTEQLRRLGEQLTSRAAQAAPGAPASAPVHDAASLEQQQAWILEAIGTIHTHEGRVLQRNLTLDPRARIAVQRSVLRRDAHGGQQFVADLTGRGLGPQTDGPWSPATGEKVHELSVFKEELNGSTAEQRKDTAWRDRQVERLVVLLQELAEHFVVEPVRAAPPGAVSQPPVPYTPTSQDHPAPAPSGALPAAPATADAGSFGAPPTATVAAGRFGPLRLRD